MTLLNYEELQDPPSLFMSRENGMLVNFKERRNPESIFILDDEDTPDVEDYGLSNKRARVTISPPSPPTPPLFDHDMYRDLCEKLGPLGLSLRKSRSFAELIQSVIDNKNQASREKKLKSTALDKMKPTHFHICYPFENRRLGAKYVNNLVAKCYYAKRKLIWEILGDDGVRRKIEISWSDITTLKLDCPKDDDGRGLGTLDIVLSKPPLFFKSNPQPKRPASWVQTVDFTGGQANKHWRHILQAPPALISKNVGKIIQCDPHLNYLSQLPDISLYEQDARKQYVCGEPRNLRSPSHLDSHDVPAPDEEQGKTYLSHITPDNPDSQASQIDPYHQLNSLPEALSDCQQPQNISRKDSSDLLTRVLSTESIESLINYLSNEDPIFPGLQEGLNGESLAPDASTDGQQSLQRMYIEQDTRETEQHASSGPRNPTSPSCWDSHNVPAPEEEHESNYLFHLTPNNSYYEASQIDSYHQLNSVLEALPDCRQPENISRKYSLDDWIIHGLSTESNKDPIVPALNEGLDGEPLVPEASIDGQQSLHISRKDSLQEQLQVGIDGEPFLLEASFYNQRSFHISREDSLDEFHYGFSGSFFFLSKDYVNRMM